MAMYAAARKFGESVPPAQSRDEIEAQNASNVRIEESRQKGLAVIARRMFEPGDVVVVGYVVGLEPLRTSRSVQVSWNRHVLMQESAVLINHSCDPSTRVVGNRHGAYNFVAIQEITADTEITYDYASTEFEPCLNFTCYCHTRECRGNWGGFASLPYDSAIRQRGYFADYLRDWDANQRYAGPGLPRAPRQRTVFSRHCY
jgi:uncharacterized protein